MRILAGMSILASGICIIEWGEIIQDILPEETIFVRFEKDENNEDYRKITVG